MSEFLGLAYYAEDPGRRVRRPARGPSTGMPTRTQQCDLMSCAYASHGDTKQVCLYPANPEECFYMAVQAFDLAERLQTPVMVLSDLDIGMNDWMCRDLKWDDSYQPDRGKVYRREDLEKMEKFYRYLDRRRGRHHLSHLPRRAPEGRVLHARLRPHAVRHVYRRFRPSTSSCSIACAQVRHREEATCRSR
jgi:2-oxoglutarate ferredoxin oxidoreductase subunit alpha